MTAGLVTLAFLGVLVITATVWTFVAEGRPREERWGDEFGGWAERQYQAIREALR